MAFVLTFSSRPTPGMPVTPSSDHLTQKADLSGASYPRRLDLSGFEAILSRCDSSNANNFRPDFPPFEGVVFWCPGAPARRIPGLTGLPYTSGQLRFELFRLLWSDLTTLGIFHCIRRPI